MRIAALLLLLPPIGACGTSRPAPGVAQGGTAATAAAAPPATASADPCRGSALDIDSLPPRCQHRRPAGDAPPRERLRIDLESPAPGIPSGADGSAWLRFRNVSSTTLVLQLEAMCGQRFDVRILRRDGEPADRENDMGGLGLCGTVPGIRVELEPGGQLSQRLAISARALRWVNEQPGGDPGSDPGGDNDGPFVLRAGAPIARGSYTLDVAIPLYTDHRLGWKGRIHVTAPLTVVGQAPDPLPSGKKP